LGHPQKKKERKRPRIRKKVKKSGNLLCQNIPVQEQPTSRFSKKGNKCPWGVSREESVELRIIHIDKEKKKQTAEKKKMVKRAKMDPSNNAPNIS